jgi:endonuclease/exonuclease/phosphatase family metal-dependent hydrolase
MLKLMTFNIRYGLADDGDNRWDSRKSLVIERIKSFDPDLIGVQECRDDFQAEFIKSQLQGYEFYGVRRAHKGDTALEMAPVLFKRSTFQLAQKGCFWLSDMPSVVGSKSWGAIFPRTATWVKLIHSTSGKSFVFLNTHFDYEPSALGESAQVLKEWIRENAKDQPILLSGDFNADKDSSAYRQLTKDGLFDVYKIAHPTDSAAGTFHGYGEASDPIDWVLASSHFEVIAAEIDRYHEGKICPSDHYPVTAIIEWKGTGNAH